MSRASLQTLPPELQSSICSDLNYVSLAALELTCRSLQRTTSIYKRKCLDARIRKSIVIPDLLEIENWECHTSHSIPSFSQAPEEADNQEPIAGRDYFACTSCLKIKRASEFADPMMTGKRGKTKGTFQARVSMNTLYIPGSPAYEELVEWMDFSSSYSKPSDLETMPHRNRSSYSCRCGGHIGRHTMQAPDRRTVRGDKLTRLCIDCGIQNSYYARGSLLEYGGAELPDNSGGGYGVVCSRCGRFGRLGVKAKIDSRRRNCSDCVDRRKR